MILQQGVHKISNEEYHHDPCPEPSLSRSTIYNLLFESPARAWFEHPRLNPNHVEDDGAGKFDIGSASHELLLEGLNNAVVVDADDWRKKEAKEQRDAARVSGKTPLLTKDYLKVCTMVAAAQKAIAESEYEIKNLRAEGDSELSYIWNEKGTWMRVRPDWISKDRKIVLDYKTTQASANPDAIGKHIVAMGYDIQEAFYRRGVKAVEGEKPIFVFLFQEAYEPYLCSFIALPPAFQEMGNQKVIQGIKAWEDCIAKNKWPGYPSRTCYVDPPAWALAAWEGKSFDVELRGAATF